MACEWVDPWAGLTPGVPNLLRHNNSPSRSRGQRPGQSLPALMGSDLDAAKTISSLTLFEAVGLPQATALLDQLGQRCPSTRAMLGLPVM